MNDNISAKVVLNTAEACVIIDALGLLGRHADTLPALTIDSCESIRRKMSTACRHINIAALQDAVREFDGDDVILDDVPDSSVDPNKVLWEPAIWANFGAESADKTSVMILEPLYGQSHPSKIGER